MEIDFNYIGAMSFLVFVEYPKECKENSVGSHVSTHCNISSNLSTQNGRYILPFKRKAPHFTHASLRFSEIFLYAIFFNIYIKNEYLIMAVRAETCSTIWQIRNSDNV